jgi:hypothetical protein
MGNLCAVLLRPLFSLVLKNSPEIKNIALYIISAAVMFFAVSYFSMREGYNDTNSFKFAYWRTALAYAISGIIFCFAAYFTRNSESAAHFYAPHFIPAEIHAILSHYIFMPDIPFLCAKDEKIKSLLAVKQNDLFLSVFLCVSFSMGFYRTGQKRCIAAQNKKNRTD